MKEIRTGFQLERATEEHRRDAAKFEAEALRNKKSDVLGRCVGVIPQRDFFRLTQKYGHDEVHSKEFMRYFNKKFPELSPNKA